jgi:hypothetical protein
MKESIDETLHFPKAVAVIIGMKYQILGCMLDDKTSTVEMELLPPRGVPFLVSAKRSAWSRNDADAIRQLVVETRKNSSCAKQPLSCPQPGA